MRHIEVALLCTAAWMACAADAAMPRGARNRAQGPASSASSTSSPIALASDAPTPLPQATAASSAVAPASTPAPGAPSTPVAPPASEKPVLAPKSAVRIKGLTGTLNKDDVHQTMEARQSAFDACIAQGRRRLRWISGSIRFAFAVGADGAVQEVHPVESSVGHWTLERCLYEATLATVFPKPAGRATARFEWTVHVEPAGGRWPTLLDESVVERPLRRHGRRVASDCELKRREQIQVTAYVTPRGRVISSGAVAEPPAATEKVECVLGAIAKWRLPRVERTGKVSFGVR